MEGKNQGTAASAFSFTAELFGTTESPPTSSTGIFASMFPTPSVVSGVKSSSSEVIGSWQKHPSGSQVWNVKQGTPSMNGEAGSYYIPDKERASILPEEGMYPCHLSSSLYYGGQDHYSQSPNNLNTGSYPTIKKDVGEDDPNGNISHGASRGNWWKGSLYY
uniref:Uncharacterized protein MANES_02G126600 n=1 Tax=Rhizophora mucronata TaxID=61149 RepID=A0A2P2QM03_RHIMU